MIVILFAAAGALWGALLARSRQGKPLDMAQYAGSFAIIGGILGMLLTIYLSRTLG